MKRAAFCLRFTGVDQPQTLQSDQMTDPLRLQCGLSTGFKWPGQRECFSVIVRNLARFTFDQYFSLLQKIGLSVGLHRIGPDDGADAHLCHLMGACVTSASQTRRGLRNLWAPSFIPRLSSRRSWSCQISVLASRVGLRRWRSRFLIGSRPCRTNPRQWSTVSRASFNGTPGRHPPPFLAVVSMFHHGRSLHF